MRKSIRVDRFPFARRIFVDKRVVSESERLSKTVVRCPITIRHETREQASLNPVLPSLVTLLVWRPATLLSCLTILLNCRTVRLNVLASLLSFPAALLNRLACLVLSRPTSLLVFRATLIDLRLTCLPSCPTSLLVFRAALIDRRFTRLLSCPTSLLSRLSTLLSRLSSRLITPNIRRSVPGDNWAVLCDFNTINPRSAAWICL